MDRYLKVGIHLLSIRYMLAAIICCLLLRPVTVAAQDSTARSHHVLDSSNQSPPFKELKPIVIKASEPPVRVKDDTVSYNVGSFHARPNAELGDVMNKMPGMEVDETGQVTALGRPIERVLVNGKRFFDGDPTFAIKMLPPDVVVRVEVYDDRSDQAKFTGVDDGIRIHTLNIITRIDVSKGTTGRMMAGVGNDGLYNTTGNLTHFDKSRIISVVEGANNTTGTAGGTSHLWNGGLNYTDNYGAHTRFNASYSQNHNATTTSSTSHTQNLVPGDSSFFVQSSQQGHNSGGSQRFNENLETDIDSADQLTLRGALSWRQTASASGSASATTKGVTQPANSSVNQNTDGNNNANGNFSLLYGHRFHNRRRSISLSINGTRGTTEDNGTNDYTNQFYVASGDSIVSARQTFHAPGKNTGSGLSLSYVEPVSRNATMDLSYTYSSSLSQTARYTYALDSLTNAPVPDSQLTNTFSNRYRTQNVGLGYSYSVKKYRFNAGVAMQQADNRSVNAYKDQVLTQSYVNFNPQANFDYTPKPGSSLNFRYAGNPVQPSLEELQPLINNTDPLHVSIGNPRLRQSFSHQFYLRYMVIKSPGFQPLYLNVGANIQENTIVQKTNTNLSTGADTTTPVNLGGNYSFRANVGYGLPLKALKSNLSIGAGFSDSHTEGFINNTLNGTSNYEIKGNVRFTTNLDKYLDANINVSPDYHLTHYSAEAANNNHYLEMGVSGNTTFYTNDGWLVSSAVNITAYSGRSAGYNTTITLWSASVGHLFFKKKRGELKFTVYDLLNQNRAVNRSETPTMIQDTESKLLARYAMLSFTYNLRKFGPGGR